MNIGVISYLFASAAYLALTILLLTSWRSRDIGAWIVLASVLSAAWAGLSAAATVIVVPAILTQTMEIARDAGWCLFLLRLLRPDVNEERQQEQDGGLFEAPPEPIPQAHKHSFHWGIVFFSLFGFALLVTIFGSALAHHLAVPTKLIADIHLVIWITLSIFGLLLVEQLYRNASTSQRWAIKYLCLGIGGIFAYDFYMFADALLFKQLDETLWLARGIVNGVAVPFIAVSIARNPGWSVRIHVSREVVFHSVTLIGAGVYLLVMAGTGYLLRLYGGSWGGLLQIAFFAGSGALLIILLFSDKIRAKIRVLLSKHFFSFKYDYRTEWLRFTQTLAQSEAPVPDRVIHAVAALVTSPGGILWAATADNDYTLLASWNMPEAQMQASHETRSLINFLEERQWIIDIAEYTREPGLYEGLELPSWLMEIPNGWLVVPLLFKDRLIGILLLKRSEIETSINWEDRDLLKMAGQQAASHLAQHLSDQALMQARQFEAFNRLSAYVVHDLKNILAQQSLIVANAEKHKHNPAFVDDVIATVRNSVDRMTRLMEQMRSGMRGTNSRPIGLNDLLSEIVSRRSSHEPVPILEVPDQPLVVEADRDQLGNVFNHLIQNAQEASAKNGRIVVRLSKAAQQAIIEVEDNGCGMDKEFIQNRLFRPFDSTKGLTGMGIGVFESREVIRSLGGDISVQSTPGEGSTFRITIPLAVQISEVPPKQKQ